MFIGAGAFIERETFFHGAGCDFSIDSKKSPVRDVPGGNIGSAATVGTGKAQTLNTDTKRPYSALFDFDTRALGSEKWNAMSSAVSVQRLPFSG